jgi:hypothetical protein
MLTTAAPAGLSDIRAHGSTLLPTQPDMDDGPTDFDQRLG